jgi:hypothetical protein
VRLDTDLDEPEKRSGFAHQNIVRWVVENRGRLVCAALTMVRAYFTAGSPKQNGDEWGSYEEWSRVVRSSCLFAGLADPAETRQYVRENCNRSGDTHQKLLDAISLIDPSGSGVSVAELLSKCRETDLNGEIAEPRHGLLIEALTELVGHELDGRAIGNRFKKLAGTPRRGRRLVPATDGSGKHRRTKHGSLWVVEGVSGASSASPALPGLEKADFYMNAGGVINGSAPAAGSTSHTLDAPDTPAAAAPAVKCNHLPQDAWVRRDGKCYCHRCGEWKGNAR